MTASPALRFLHLLLLQPWIVPHRSSAFAFAPYVPPTTRPCRISTPRQRPTGVRGSRGAPKSSLVRDANAASGIEDDGAVSAEIEALMSKYDPILLFASRLLPRTTAKDASALYAWCRRLDELTDDPDADLATIRRRLTDWEVRFDALCRDEPSDAMDAALAECLRLNAGSLDEGPFRDMIEGMRSDAVENRTVASMDDLEVYAYRVAGTVGLMLLPLLDAEIEQARAPAIALGKAIQLINILRDAKPDAALGRVYLPQDMLASEGVSNAEILDLRTASPGYRTIVEKVAARARELLAEAEDGKSSLLGLGPLFVQIIVELYRGYLVKLERLGYDNLGSDRERVKISALQKMAASVKAVFVVLSPI
ncbi:hypothetical protein ACHAWF_003491 [Thalassiosira exigua]